ncbi:hypothetical protein T265_05033 [Opisthorchis viverrini]|uniref:MD-2-related lipid-recognition domain-containing protein n=1 Tax=Opisthorchis viverrini TaxID=6198 RepID=A0A074ZLV5_OPIVI|nr:hypothetical protein T265_05033 [Opisthorchis viverrini]KER28051.1 hypothetical protein T265_05033 [Opisthorchis viverrini]
MTLRFAGAKCIPINAATWASSSTITCNFSSSSKHLAPAINMTSVQKNSFYHYPDDQITNLQEQPFGKQPNVVKGFTIEECRNEPCTLKTGQTLTGSMVFEPTHEFPAIVPWVRVTGTLGLNYWIKFPSPYVDGCKFTTPPCPIKSGSFYTIDIQTKVPKRKPEKNHAAQRIAHPSPMTLNVTSVACCPKTEVLQANDGKAL